MKYTDGYDIVVEEGLLHVRPMDVLLQQAVSLVPKERWQECPKCGLKCPLMFGDPNGEHWCAHCQIKEELNING